MNILEAMQRAITHHQAKNLAEAEKLYRQVLAVDPQYPDAIQLLGVLALQHGKLADAEKLIGRAIHLSPTNAEYHFNMGRVLAEQKRLDLAAGAFRHTLSLRPLDAESHYSLGLVLEKQRKISEAITHFEAAVKLAPRHASALTALGVILPLVGRSDDAIDCCRRTLAIEPDWAAPHLNLGVLLLAKGDFAHGWDEYEWRWKVSDLTVAPLTTDHPQWDGAELGGKRIVLHSEQGYGDTIQMIRFAERVRQRGGRTIIYCQPDLTRLLRTVRGVDEIVPWGKTPPQCDEHCPLLSLPRVFKIELGNIPSDVPYLSADPDLSWQWRERMGGDKRLKVGMVWAGSPKHLRDHQRSIPLTQFAPLAARADVRFFSLQKGKTAEQARSAPFEMTDWSDDLKDLADTAALVANLDLVICVDTSVAHLAAAMGKPVWLLLPFLSDWRWLLGRTDSPWYPTMRLFRQKKPDDWSAPLAELSEALRTL